MKQKIFHNPLLKRLVPISALAFITMSVSLSSIADPIDSPSPVEKSNSVSKLLKRLREKEELKNKPVVSEEKQTQISAPAKTEPKAKKRHTPTIKAKPEPVHISSAPAEKKQATPRRKISLDALNKFYIRADYGMGWPQKVKTISFKKSTMYGGGIGYKFNQVFRADINYQFRKLSAKRPIQFDKLQQSSVLLNGYLNLMDESSFVIPYLTTGVGYARNKLKDFVHRELGAEYKTSGKNTNTFVWNGGVGTIINISKHIKLDVAYRYIDLGKAKGNAKIVFPVKTVDYHLKITKLHSHEVTGGLLINF